MPLSLVAKTDIREGYNITFCVKCFTNETQEVSKDFTVVQDKVIPVAITQKSSYFAEAPKDNFTINAEEKPLIFNYFSPRIVKATEDKELHISSSGFDQLSGS